MAEATTEPHHIPADGPTGWEPLCGSSSTKMSVIPWVYPEGVCSDCGRILEQNIAFRKKAREEDGKT